MQNRHQGPQSHVRSEGASGNGFDIALIGERTADMGNLDILVSGTQIESHLHDKTFFHEAVHIQGKKYAHWRPSFARSQGHKA